MTTPATKPGAAPERPKFAPPPGARRGPGGGGPFGGGMGMPAEKSLNFGPSAKRLLRRMNPERLGLIMVIALGVISVVLSVLGPKILGNATNIIFDGVVSKQLPAGITQQQAIDAARAAGNDQQANMLSAMTLTPGQGIDFTELGRVLMMVLVLYVFASVFAYLQGYLLNGIVQRTILKLRAEVEDKLNSLPLRYLDKHQRGEVLSRVTNDIDNISQTLQQTLSQTLTSLLTVVGVLVMMVIISPVLAIVALIAIPLSLLVTTMVAKRSQPKFIAQWRSTGELNARVEETFTGHSLVKVFGRQKDAEKAFEDKNAELYESSFGAQFLSGLIMPSLMFIANLTYVVIAVVGGLFVASGSCRSATCRRSSSTPGSSPSRSPSWRRWRTSCSPGWRPRNGSSSSSTPTSSPLIRPIPSGCGPRAGRVEFTDVAFRYEPETPLIDDLSLVAAPGQTVAIVGPTGAGKTTLVNLIMRFYEIDSGRITLDGVDISRLTRADLRSRIGMVLQDTWLFAGTIRDNIAYGRPDATEDEILAAARATYVDRFVHSLPDGYDTLIDDEGSNISAGEKQLLTIARAFLADPALLILDEATSSVDTRTEVLVQHAMAALRQDRTSFVIAHRLSTIRDADLILVMKAGAIVEQGTHTELLEAGGAYADLYNAQFAGAIVDA